MEEELYRQYIGGSGLGIKILHDMTNEQTDPLGAYNPIIWMTGALTCTDTVSSERYHVISRSPLTKKISESSAGGLFGTTLKKSGYDGIIVTGTSDVPVSIVVDGDNVEFLPADDIWGKDIYTVDSYFNEKYGADCGISSIGPAGEKQILIAGIASGLQNARMAGRSGLGAVMGSKKLKTIVIKDNKNINFKIANESTFKQLQNKLNLKNKNKLSDTGIANRTLTEISRNNAANKNYYCASCYMECARNSDNLFGKWGKNSNFGLEYEAMSLMGNICMIEDISSIEKAAKLCNQNGLDVIDVASSIAIAMKCYEMGYLTETDLDGIKAEWGNGNAFVELTEKICNNEGIGRLLGNGAAFAVRRIAGAGMLGLHVKGLAVGYNKTQQLAKRDKDKYYKYFYDRLKKRNKYENARKAMETHSYSAEITEILNSLGICKFSVLGQGTLSELCDCYSAVTGKKMTTEELSQAAQKICTLKNIE